MTSEQISKITHSNMWTANEVQAEVAYQLAVMNERKEKEIYNKGWNEGLDFFVENVIKPAQEHGLEGLKRAV